MLPSGFAGVLPDREAVRFNLFSSPHPAGHLESGRRLQTQDWVCALLALPQAKLGATNVIVFMFMTTKLKGLG